jgi:hypothetical protein
MKILSITTLILTSALLGANPPQQAVNPDAVEAAIKAGKNAIIEEYPYFAPTDIVPLSVQYQYILMDRGEKEELSVSDPPKVDSFKMKFYLTPTITVKLKPYEKNPKQFYPSRFQYLVADIDLDNQTRGTKTEYHISRPTWSAAKGGFAYMQERHKDDDLRILSDAEEVAIIKDMVKQSIDPNTFTLVSGLEIESTEKLVESLLEDGYNVGNAETASDKTPPRFAIYNLIEIKDNTMLANIWTHSSQRYMTLEKRDGQWLITDSKTRIIVD